jgi:hypothetical protein
VINFFKVIDEDAIDLANCLYCQLRVAFAIKAYQATGKTKDARMLAERLRGHVHEAVSYQKLIEFYISDGDTSSANHLLRQAAMEVESRYKPYLFLVAGRQAYLSKDLKLRDHYASLSATYAPDSSRALARSYYLMDSLDSSLEIYTLSLPENSWDHRIYGEMGLIYARKKDTANAEEMINRLEAMRERFDYGTTSYFQGRIAAHLGDKERALRLLERSLEEGNKYISSEFYAQDPDLMLLRDDSAFRKLLTRK